MELTFGISFVIIANNMKENRIISLASFTGSGLAEGAGASFGVG